MNLTEIGEVFWTNQDIINEIDNFLELYSKRPIKQNAGGMTSMHCFATYFILKKINKPFIIESGSWKGQSTWLIENTCPNSEVLTIEPILERLIYKSSKVKYIRNDWTTLRLENTNETICFFDDHQNAVNRIRHAVENGYKHLIFEDNYPIGQGDCVSLKQTFIKNNEDTEFIKKHIKIYYEFPPVFKHEYTRWGDLWDDKYPTKSPLLIPNKNNEKYRIFYDESRDYTWISYVELY
jgi:hypothetical protein